MVKMASSVPPAYERLAIVAARERELLASYGAPQSWQDVCAQGWPCDVESGVVFIYSDDAAASFERAGWALQWSCDDGDVAVRAAMYLPRQGDPEDQR